jgi:Holliday junction DNA helicase RuvA
MIHSIYGRITGQLGNTLYIENNGIEWALEVSQHTMQEIAAHTGQVRIFTYLHHRQDTMLMFGFSAIEERDIFFELIKISGIGPKQALRILSGLSPDQFMQAIDQEQVDMLSHVPGVGKKTAGKIILALRGTLLTTRQQEESERYPELVNALNDMGFDRRQARKALQEVAKQLESDTLPVHEHEHELFRRAIIYLSSNS